MITTTCYIEDHVKTTLKGVSCEIPYCALALAGESGEVANVVKKMIRDGGGELTPEIRQKLILELGDVLWYVTALTLALGGDLEEVVDANVLKLQERRASKRYEEATG